MLRKFLVIGVLLIPVSMQVVWQFINNGLPIADGGDHFRISYLIYLAFKEGIVHGIHFSLHTGGKPILFSVFAAPFVFLAKYDTLLPIRLFLIVICALTTFAYYWLFTARMKPLISSLLTAVIMTIPYVFSRSSQFMPEVVWHLWFVLFLGALVRSRDLTDKKMAIMSGLFLSLTILARSAESIILLAPPLTLYLYYLHVEYVKCSMSRMILSIIVVSLSVIACILCGFEQIPTLVGYLTILMSASILFLVFRRSSSSSFNRSLIKPGLSDFANSNPSIELFFLPIAIICSIWLLYNASDIYYWAYDNSFGQGAKTNDQVNLSKSTILIFFDIVRFYGPISIITIAFLACISLLFERRADSAIKNKYFYYVIAAVVLMLMPMLVAYSLTGTSDMRRILLGMIFLIVVMCFIGFDNDRLPRYLSNVIVSITISLCCVQLVLLASVISGNKQLLIVYKRLNTVIGPFNYPTPSPQGSEDVNVILEIKSLGISNTKIAVFSLGMFSDHVLFQAESLRYVTLAVDPSLQFGTCWAYANYDSYENVIERLQDNDFKYVLLEDLDNPIKDPSLRKRLQSHTFFVHDLLKRIKKNGENHLPNLALIKKFMIEGRTIYLFKIYSSYNAVVTASTKFQYGPEGLFERRSPGWHSAYHPVYPQTVTVDFQKSLSFHSLGLLPQDGNVSRAPSKIQVQISHNGGKSWETVANSVVSCASKATNRWRNIVLDRPVKTRFMRVNILANCGATDLLTLRGLKVV